jgi:DNA replication protein DnaC
MERLGEILKRTGTNTSREDTDTWSSAEASEKVSETEECPICNGARFVHPLLPSGRPDFTRVVPCKCTKEKRDGERLSRLRRASGELGLELLRNMTFENFERRINLPPEEQENLERALNDARKFAEEPKDWIVFLGVNGCGKTHLL